MHLSTYDYLTPTEPQAEAMAIVRQAAKLFSDTLEATLPDGPDKTHAIRQHRTTAMWAMVAITRQADGSPRS